MIIRAIFGIWITGILGTLSTQVAGSTWEVDSLDAGAVPAKYTSLQVDQQGNVHLVYVLADGNKYPLRYAFWDHRQQRWFITTVDEGAAVCSLALDSKQRPHISYTDYGGGRLRYAYWDGVSWKKEALRLNSENVNYYNSLVLDNNDNPSISYYEYRGPAGTDIRIRLRHVVRNGSQWEVRTVDPEEGSGKFNSLAVDSLGHFHLAYANVSAGTNGMRYANWNGRSWTSSIVEAGDVGWSCFSALDKKGQPHITYMDVKSNLVRYGVLKHGKWTLQSVAKVSGVGYPDRNSLAFDDQDRPYVGYYDAGLGRLNIAYKAGDEAWISETVDGDGCGFTSSMQINNGIIWISYTDDRNGGVKIARRKISSQASAKSAN